MSYSIGGTSRRLQRFMSGGIWGIESDCGEDYMREQEQEQLEELKRHLEVFGIDVSRLAEVFEASKDNKASPDKYSYTG